MSTRSDHTGQNITGQRGLVGKGKMQSYPSNKPEDYELDTTGLSDIKFGRELREKEFLLKPGIAFVNHGSYGTVPRRLLDLQNKYNVQREEHLDMWFRLNAKMYLDKTRQILADFIGADVDDLVMVNNVTTAINVLVRSYPFKAGEAILDGSLTYGSINNLCTDFTTRIRPDVERVKVEITLPIQSEDDILDKYEETFQQKPNIKFVIIDHITSPTALIMPVRKLVDLCHQHGAVVIVDGAHAICQLPLDMREFGADAYTTNVHKWGFAPRGSALLWFDPKHASWINPPNTSWQIGDHISKQFFDQGTRDHIPFICARHGLDFYNAIGGMEKVVGYTSQLADKAKDLFVKEVGLEPLAIPPAMEAPNMRLLKLPPLKNFPCTLDTLWSLQAAIFGPSNVFGILVMVEQQFYFRFSIQVYNDMDDVWAMVNLFKDFIRENA